MVDAVTLSAVQIAQRKNAMYSVRQALGLKGQADRDRSAARSVAAQADSIASVFTEGWGNLTAWAQTLSTGLQVSGGRLFAGTTPGGSSAANHSYAIPTILGKMRAVTSLRLNGGFITGGNVIIGISSATPGAAPSAGAANARGIAFGPSGLVQKWDNGAGPNLGTYDATKDYVVTVIADGNYVSVVATPTDSSAGEFRARWLQNTGGVNNLFVFNSDSRALTGASIGPMGAVKSLSTISPRPGIEGVGRTVHWTNAPGTPAAMKITLPANYDSRIPSPLAICFHGDGSDENLYSDNVDANATAVGNALVAEGYIVLTAAYSPNTSTWGAQLGLDAYYNAYTYARDNYNIGQVVLHADSMGGIESLLTIAEQRIPGIVAWFGSSPTASLAACYSTGQNFSAKINTAYGIPGSGTYAARTAGHDPALMGGDAFCGIPMRFYAATDDTSVVKTLNADVMAAIVKPFSSDSELVSVTGGHGAPAAFPAGTIVAFFNKYAS